MIHRRVSWLAALLLIPLTFVVQARAEGPLDGLESYVEDAMRDWKLPGLAIAVVKDDKVVLARGFGVRTLGKPERVDEKTMFALASNTKAFTATALGLLVNEGKLRWDDPVSTRLPELRLYDALAGRDLTIRDLLCHRIGLGTWQGDLVWYGSDRSRDEVLRLVRFLPPAHSFRDRYGYCNLAFIAAGQIIPNVTGQSWESFVKERLFDPLEMTRTNTNIHTLELMNNVATPHTLIDSQVVAIPHRDLDNTAPAGAINSCVLDWTRWMRLQLGNGMIDGKRIVPRAILRETHTPQNLVRPMPERIRSLSPTTHFFAYGLGWFLQDYQGRLIVQHSGGMDGMLSLTMLVPEERLGVVVLTNYDEQEFYSALPYRVIDAYLKVKPRDWSGELLRLRQDREANERAAAKAAEPKDQPRPSLELASYAGTYHHDALGTATITIKDGVLRLEIERNAGLRADLRHVQSDIFEAAWSDPFLHKSAIPFRLNADGRPVEFRMIVRPDFIDPMEYVFTRAR